MSFCNNLKHTIMSIKNNNYGIGFRRKLETKHNKPFSHASRKSFSSSVVSSFTSLTSFKARNVYGEETSVPWYRAAITTESEYGQTLMCIPLKTSDHSHEKAGHTGVTCEGSCFRRLSQRSREDSKRRHAAKPISSGGVIVVASFRLRAAAGLKIGPPFVF